MKRFLVFTFDDCYPGGGWNDYRGDFDTIEEACKRIETLRPDCEQIVDTLTGLEVEIPYADGFAYWRLHRW